MFRVMPKVDADDASKRAGRQGVEDKSWRSVQLLASLGPWIAGDDSAATTLDESVGRTPRYRVDADRWLRIHRALLDAYAQVAAYPDHNGQIGRLPHPGDLIVLNSAESPRVRVVLDVRPSSNDWKVVFFDPGDEEQEREFLASRVATLPWTPVPTRSAVSA
jgi:hypothetical protein